MKGLTMYNINDDAKLLINLDDSLSEESKNDLKDTLNHYINVLVNELGENLVSVILHGSLCTGDFDLKTSDIDLTVTTQTALTMNDFYLMSHLHNSMKVHSPNWGERLEISYITHEELYTMSPPPHPRIYLNGGHTKQEPYGAEWYFEKNTICLSGLSIYGQGLKREELTVTPTKLRVAAFQILMDWWKPIISRGMHHLSDDYLTYAVLSMCRIITTIELGQNLSKYESARMVLDKQLSAYNDLIEHVINLKTIHTDYKSKAIEFVKETVESYLRDYE